MDTFGKCDPFVIVSHGGINTETPHVIKTYNPIWNKELLVKNYERVYI